MPFEDHAAKVPEEPRLTDAAVGSNGRNTCIAHLEPNFGAKTILRGGRFVRVFLLAAVHKINCLIICGNNFFCLACNIRRSVARLIEC